MKHMITKTIGLILALAIIFAGIPCTETQAATAKPVIGSSQVTIKNNSCTIETGKKVKLTAKSSKKNVTTKGIWKSSKKSVATVSKKGVLATKKTGTTYITVKYKGKTSNKLKVIVKKDSTSTAVSKTKVQAQAAHYVPINEVGTYNPEIITPELLKACQLPKLDKSRLPYWTGYILENKISVNSGRDSEWEQYTAGNWYWNEQEIKYLKDNGFNCVRALYSLSFLSNPDDIYSINVSELEQLDELISWCIKYNVHLMIAQTGLPGKWNLDDNGWHDSYDYWCAQENVATNPELYTSQDMQKAYTAYYDMLAKRYQDIPNGILSFELATEGAVPAEENASALHLQAEVLGPVAQTIWSYSPNRIVIVNDVWDMAPWEMAAMGCCIAKHSHVYALGEADSLELPEDYKQHWPMPYVPDLVNETSGSLILTAEDSFQAGEIMVGYSYYNRLPEILADDKIIFKQESTSPVYKSGTFSAQIPSGTKRIEIKIQDEIKINWVRLSQAGKYSIILPTSQTNAKPMPMPHFVVENDGSLKRSDGSSAAMNKDDFVNAFVKDFIDCAAENGVSFIATEVGTDTLYLSPEEYVGYHEVLLQAYKENGIGWMYNCVHNILAPKSLMWLNNENSKFTDFSNVEDMYGYQVNNTVMDMLKRFQ